MKAKCIKALRFGMVVLLTFFFVAIQAQAAIAAGKESPIKLKWATFAPKAHPAAVGIIQFARNIETYSKGAVKVKLYWSGEIAQVKDLIALCRKGSIEMVTTAPIYYSGLLPINSAFQSYHVMNKTPTQAVYTWRKMFKEFPEIQDEFGKSNIHVLNRASLGMYYLISKKRVRNLDDLNGMKLRTVGGDYPSKLAKAAGAVSVFQPSAEMYEGFMRGVTDGVQLDVASFYGYKLYEIGKNVGFPIGTILGWANMINLDVWKGFSPEIKEAFNKAAVDWGRRDLQIQLKSEKDNREKLKKAGVQFHEFDQKDWQKIVARAGDPYAHVRGYLKKANLSEAVISKFVNAWKAANEEYETEYLTTGRTWVYE